MNEAMSLKNKEVGLQQEQKEKLSLRILVADDTAVVRRAFCSMLKIMGHTVIEFEDGESLLGYLEEGGGGDLILSDNSMREGGKRGIEVLRELRSKPQFENLPFILSTTDMDGSLEPEVESLGGLFLAKPVNLEQLRNAVDHFIKQKE